MVSARTAPQPSGTGGYTNTEPGGNGQREASAPLARWLAWVVIALMVAATAYTAWIALTNFNRIGV